MKTYGKKQQERINKKQCIKCGVDTGGKVLCSEHMRKQVEYSSSWAKELRREVFEHYGNKCECCGETNDGFLTIDHIDGNIEREKCGTSLYSRLRREGYPDNVRILCWNCNCGRRNGICPHKAS